MPPAKLIYAASESCADLLYATGVFTPDAFLWFQVGDERVVVVSPLEYGRMSQQVKAGTLVLSLDQAKQRFRPRTGKAAALIAAITRACRVARWEVPGDFPLRLANDLRRRRVSLRPAQGTLFPERSCKSAAEIELVTEGLRLAEHGLETALEILRQARIAGNGLRWQGTALTADRLRGEIDAAIMRRGGIAAYTIVAPGRHGADPHDVGAGPIRPHQPLVLDIFPRVGRTGYFGDLTRTVVKGQASEVVRRAFAAVQAARDHGKTLIRAGANGKDVHQAVQRVLAEAGFATDAKAEPPHGFFHGTGHGVGLEIHEAPRLGGVDEPLQAGQVVTVEPGLYYPEWGGLRLEDVVVVEESGCRTLTRVPDVLEIP